MPSVPGAGAGAAAGAPLDYSSDPMLQQIRQLVQRNLATAEAGTAAARNQALIRFGFDNNLASLYGDQGTAGAAKANPFSTLAVLARQHEARARNLDENLNKGNLFFSGYRGKQLANEGMQYLGEQNAAGSALQDYLGGLSERLAGTRSSEQDRLIQAQQDAYQRALDFGLKYGTPGGAATGAGASRGAVAMRHPTRSALIGQLRRARPRPAPRPRVSGHYPVGP